MTLNLGQMKIENLTNLKFEIWKFKFAVISETVSDRAKRSKFFTLQGYGMQKLQILKFSFCWFLIG